MHPNGISSFFGHKNIIFAGYQPSYLNTLAPGWFWRFSAKKKHLNARGFADEYLFALATRRNSQNTRPVQ